jgi:hypothetical protein
MMAGFFPSRVVPAHPRLADDGTQAYALTPYRVMHVLDAMVNDPDQVEAVLAHRVIARALRDLYAAHLSPRT